MNRFHIEIEKMRANANNYTFLKFNNEFESNNEISEWTTYIEDMLSLFELNPLFSIGNGCCTLGNDLLDMRRAFSYELQYRFIKLIRSIIINCNDYNEYGCAISLRSLYELEFLLEYLHNGNINNVGFYEKILCGISFNVLDREDLESEWKEDKNDKLPENIISFLEKNYKIPHISKYKKFHNKNFKVKDDWMYLFLCEYAHPNFNNIRERNISLIDYFNENNRHPLTSESYYKKIMNIKEKNLLKWQIEFIAIILQDIYALYCKIDPVITGEFDIEIISFLKNKNRTKDEDTILNICLVRAEITSSLKE